MIYHFMAEQTNANLDFDMTLDKEKSVYCFIGENAVGKTNLLENMAKALLYCHSMFRKQANLKYSDLYRKKMIYENIKDFVLELASSISFNQTTVKDKKQDEWNSIPFELLTNKNSVFTVDKPLVFIGAKNRGYTKNIDKDHIKILGNQFDRFLEAFVRSFNYMNGGAVFNTEIADWFNSRLIINPSFVPQNQNRVFEVETIFKLMQKLDPQLINLLTETDGKTDLNLVFSEGQLYINYVPLDKLSTGFVSLIKIFQEIVAAYGGWAGLHDEQALSNVEGIVFIDEIESHLHPKWQYRIIPLLKEFFPNTTFYIATHSPLIVSATEEGEAYELVRKDNQVTAHKLGNPREWYLTSVFAQAFHVDFLRTKDSSNTNTLDLLKAFSTKVKNYASHKDENLKQEAEVLYQKILPSLADNDPRRRSLDSLRSLME